MTMTQQEFDKWESDLEKAGYRKYDTLTGKCGDEKAFSWFKVAKRDEDGEWFVQIEWRIWDWRPYLGRYRVSDPFTFTLVVRINDRLGTLLDCACPDSIEEGELIAKRFYEFNKSVCSEIEQKQNHKQN